MTANTIDLDATDIRPDSRTLIWPRVGSPQAAAAYDRWLEQQADAHMEALYGDAQDEDEGDRGWRYGPDPDEAHDRMMDDRMEREESWH